jgi:rhodanese-related sulfurtransferase
MADKSPGKSLRKPALSRKERRAAKRAAAIAVIDVRTAHPWRAPEPGTDSSINVTSRFLAS